MVNHWGETWKTFEELNQRLEELGIDEIIEGHDV